jgi:hypothetical protein
LSAPDATAIQFNFKTPTGGLHNIYASSVPEAIELIDAFRDELIGAIFDVEQKINAAYAVAHTPAPTPQPQVAAVAQPPAAAAPAGDAGHLCDHGQPMKLIPAGISKASGKPYKAFYACAQPRGMQCDKRVSV